MMQKLVSELLQGLLSDRSNKWVTDTFGCSRVTAEAWRKGHRLVSDQYYFIAMKVCGLKPIFDQEAMAMIDYLEARIGRINLVLRVGYNKKYTRNIHAHNGLIVARWRYHTLLEVYTHEVNRDSSFVADINDRLRNRSSQRSEGDSRERWEGRERREGYASNNPLA